MKIKFSEDSEYTIFEFLLIWGSVIIGCIIFLSFFISPNTEISKFFRHISISLGSALDFLILGVIILSLTLGYAILFISNFIFHFNSSIVISLSTPIIFIFAGLCAKLYKDKNRNTLVGFLVGLLTGSIGYIGSYFYFKYKK